jgi:hypothetical protein
MQIDWRRSEAGELRRFCVAISGTVAQMEK